MALSYNLGYQEIISVHPTRHQIFAGKPYSTFPNIWEWVIYIFNFNFQKLDLKVLNLINFLIWQKQVRICWARKLNSFQPRIFSAQWEREGKIKVNFELRSIHAPTVHLVTKRNEAEWRRKDKNKSIHTIQYPTSSPWPPCLYTFLNWILSNHNGPIRPSWTLPNSLENPNTNDFN